MTSQLLPVGAVIVQKRPKCRWLTALGRISQERFKRWSGSFKPLPGTIILIKVPDMPSLPASSWLENATEYCIKVRKTGLAGKESNISVTVWRRINWWHRLSAEIFKLRCATAFHLVQPVDGLLVSWNARMVFPPITATSIDCHSLSFAHHKVSGLTKNHQILHWHPCRSGLHLWRH